ncbi:hexose transporter protein [Rutstroemia sp. NJR-2017a BVV2]|nr:hexose transporter protein [Rutstroemia sp. NJR-2017a BVV2]
MESLVAIEATVAKKTSALEPSTWAWRIPSILQGVPPLVAVAILLFLPESPRWLACNDRQVEALEVLAKDNGPVVQLQHREILDTLEYEKSDNKSTGFVESIRNAANRKHLSLALSIAPLAMLTGSNVITRSTPRLISLDQQNPTTQLQINVTLSAWQLVVAVSGTFLAERLGRRLLALLSLGACAIFLYLLAGLTAKFGTSSDKSGIYGTVACIFLFLSYSFVITPLTAMYALEVLFYNMRANGIAMQGICIEVCGVFVTMAFPYMLESLGWKTYIFNASWNILFWVYGYFQWVETRGRTLEEIDELFDWEKHSHVPNLSDIKGVENGIIIGKETTESTTAEFVEVARSDIRH